MAGEGVDMLVMAVRGEKPSARAESERRRVEHESVTRAVVRKRKIASN